jgi:hypothetical protein
VAVGSNVSINDLALADAVKTYPNPTDGLVTIELPADRNVNHISVSDMTGRTVRHIPVQQTDRLVLDISALAGGVYYLNFFTDTSRATKKLVYLRP